MIGPEEIRNGLHCRRFGKKIFAFQSIDSTNTRARLLAGSGEEEGTLVIAEEQTAGKGRLGRTWQATSGENLTFSIILRPDIPPEKINLLPLGIAVAAARAIDTSTGISVCCKWPNDLLLDGKKCAGILMESAMGSRGVEYLVVGIGINVNQRIFPEELRQKATSLSLHAGRPADRVTLLRALLESLEAHYDAYLGGGFDSVVPSWLSLAPIIGRRVTADTQGTLLIGTVIGISADGGLQIRTDAGDRTLFAGDVTILDMESYAPRN